MDAINVETRLYFKERISGPATELRFLISKGEFVVEVGNGAYVLLVGFVIKAEVAESTLTTPGIASRY